MRNYFVIIVLSIIFVGCGENWLEDRILETQAQRDSVASLESRLLSHTAQNELSGNDQDWDDAIAKAYKVALWTYGTPVLVGYDSWGRGNPSGHWKYLYTDSTRVR